LIFDIKIRDLALPTISRLRSSLGFFKPTDFKPIILVGGLSGPKTVFVSQRQQTSCYGRRRTKFVPSGRGKGKKGMVKKEGEGVKGKDDLNPTLF